MSENIKCFCGKSFARGRALKETCCDGCKVLLRTVRSWLAEHPEQSGMTLLQVVNPTETAPLNETAERRRNTPATPENAPGGFPVKVTDGSDAFLQLLYRVNNNRLKG